MKLTKLVGIFLLLLVALTVVGMVLNDQVYWNFYNYLTIGAAGILGIVLLLKK